MLVDGLLVVFKYTYNVVGGGGGGGGGGAKAVLQVCTCSCQVGKVLLFIRAQGCLSPLIASSKAWGRG